MPKILEINSREEIRELEVKVQKERERYKLSTQNVSGGYSAIPMLPINSAVRYLITILVKMWINVFFVLLIVKSSER